MAAVVAAMSLGSAGAVLAAVEPAFGYATTPAQPFLNNPDAADWIGSYEVGGTPLFAVQFGHLAPDADEQYQPGGALTTKWGTAVPPDVLAGLNSLLVRYEGSTSNDIDAALAHIIHGFTSGPQSPGQLDPTNDFRHIAYDGPFHLTKLPTSAQALVPILVDEMAEYAGAWQVDITEPAGPHVLARPATWTVDVTTASSAVVPGVPVTVTVTGGSIDGAGPGPVSLTTPTDGTPLAFEVTPTSASFDVLVSAQGPAAAPSMLQPVQGDDTRLIGPEVEPIGADLAAAAEPAGIVLTPESGSITLGESQAYTVQTVDDEGATVDDVSAAAVLSITPDGSCTASTCAPASVGPHVVIAALGQLSATANLDVVAMTTTTTTTLPETTTTATSQPPATSSTSTTVAPATPAPTAPTTTVPVVLPVTGTGFGRSSGVALAALLGGLGLLVLARRRRAAV